ncbi:hypothetical protein C8J56DRAFT_442742 [Mycena floridula]|nr:hypothetical protein C8J56DRAFT_442742 [Mycena floridula]
MSAVKSNGGGSEVLRPILLRSATPASNEKVLSYLEGMARDGGSDEPPPPSMIDHEEYRKTPQPSSRILSPIPRSHHSEALEELAKSPVNYDGMSAPRLDGYDEDVSSVVQEQSEAETPTLPMREPGPHDPPGPHYESYDSGPSFGNFGPMPDDHHNPYVYSTWTPEWNGVRPENVVPPWKLDTGYSKPLSAIGIALPESILQSPQPASVNIRIESPSNASKARMSHSTTSPPKSESPVKSRKGTSRAASPPQENDSAPMSPVSRKSHATRATDKGTVYPPLPDDQSGIDSYGSPRSKANTRSKAPSISPSDSPSQVKHRPRSPPEKEHHRQTPTSRPPPPGSVMSGGHQSRPFSPYRHAPTQEDLLYAATRGRALVIPEESEEQSHHSKPTIAPPSPPASPRSRHSKIPSERPASKVPGEGERTPTPSRPASPDELNEEEQRIVQNALTPRTSFYSPSTLDPEILAPYHDMELCILFGQLNDPNAHEYVKKAVRKAVRQRIKRLGMKHDNDALREFQQMHNHDPSVHLNHQHSGDEPPRWASDLKREMVLMQQRIESLGPKIDNMARSTSLNDEEPKYYGEEYSQAPGTQTVNIHTQPTGTLAGSMYQVPETEGQTHEQDHEFDDITTQRQGEGRYAMSDNARDDSPGQQFLEEELYKLRQKPKGLGSQSGLSQRTHNTWEVAQHHRGEDYEEGDEEEEEEDGDQPIGGTIPGSDAYHDNRARSSPPLPELPREASLIPATPPPWNAYEESMQQLPAWQKIHQRLLTWAITWPTSTLDAALNSTTRGQQVDEVALSVWSTQTYKRYVRSRLTDSPQGVVDRLFVPPNVAESISNAVFNGRHGDACGMLRDLWTPFGLDGMPRLLVVLAKHRTDDNHWVVHRFCLPDGSLTTYDSYPERTLPDGRPLGWWFAIRVAWPNAIYPSPDHLMQKMVRLHRPMQLGIDNSVSAAGIWRNILMGSRAERSLDLERLRDLINTEVKNLRQRKFLGKLSVAPPNH